MTAPISNGPTTHGYTTMRDATDPLGEKCWKQAVLAEWVCTLAELVGVDASIALSGAAGDADASGICQLGPTTGTRNSLMRS